MRNQWAPFAFFTGALLLSSSATEADQEQISTKLLEKATAKATHIQHLIATANEGVGESQYQLGLMIFEEGREFGEFRAAALEWFLRAARQGHHSAQWRVSDLYGAMAQNRDCPSTVKRYSMLALAWDRVLVRSKGEETIEYANGVKHTRSELLRGHMTDDQVAEAEQLSREIEREIQRVER